MAVSRTALREPPIDAATVLAYLDRGVAMSAAARLAATPIWGSETVKIPVRRY